MLKCLMNAVPCGIIAGLLLGGVGILLLDGVITPPQCIVTVVIGALLSLCHKDIVADGGYI